MFNKFLSGVIVFFVVGSACTAQITSPEKSVIKQLNKMRWQKTRDLVNKGLQKDTLNPGLNFLYAKFFFSAQNPAFHIDSAYYFVQEASKDLQFVSRKDKDRLSKLDIDSVTIDRLRQRIDSAAFERAKSVNTEAAFLHFLRDFPLAKQHQEAIALRDEAAYLDAVKTNTYQGFLNFLQKYPKATKAPEAQNTYERLLYQSKTKDRSLSAYETFLKEYPATPYRPEVEKHIFEISAASGTRQAFHTFIQKYPRSKMSLRARNILFHLLIHQDSVASSEILNDSLTNIRALTRDYLVAFLKDDKFGFMSPDGEVIIQPHLSSISEDYYCDHVESDVLLIDGNLMGVDGRFFYKDSVQNFEDIGSGFLQVNSKECSKIIHKSGFIFSDCINEGKIIGGQFIGIRKKDSWALYAFTGKILTPFDWEDISASGNVLIFKKKSNHALALKTEVAAAAEMGHVKFSRTYESVKVVSNGLFLVSRGGEYALVDDRLEEIIPFGRHEIRNTTFGYIVESDSAVQLMNTDFTHTVRAEKMVVNDPWIGILNSNSWKLITNNFQEISGRYDSLSFAGPFAIGFVGDSAHVYVSASVVMAFQRSTKVDFIPGKNSDAFLVVFQDGKQTVYSSSGDRLFSGDYENLRYAGEGLFVIEKKQKFGLLNTQGKLALPIEYDAIVNTGANIFSLLKNMKFGAYHAANRILIKPQFAKNLVVYNRNLLVGFQKGFYGFIDWKSKPHGSFSFDEITFWNDSTALIKEGLSYAFYNLKNLRKVGQALNSFSLLQEDEDEKIAIVKQDISYGVVSSKRNYIIPPAFTSIINIGTRERPTYKTEKHVEEAMIYVVIYYDGNGKLLSRYVYEEAEYENYICD